MGCSNSNLYSDDALNENSAKFNDERHILFSDRLDAMCIIKATNEGYDTYFDRVTLALKRFKFHQLSEDEFGVLLALSGLARPEDQAMRSALLRSVILDKKLKLEKTIKAMVAHWRQKTKEAMKDSQYIQGVPKIRQQRYQKRHQRLLARCSVHWRSPCVCKSAKNSAETRSSHGGKRTRYQNRDLNFTIRLKSSDVREMLSVFLGTYHTTPSGQFECRRGKADRYHQYRSKLQSHITGGNYKTMERCFRTHQNDSAERVHANNQECIRNSERVSQLECRNTLESSSHYQQIKRKRVQLNLEPIVIFY